MDENNAYDELRDRNMDIQRLYDRGIYLDEIDEDELDKFYEEEAERLESEDDK